MSDDKPKYTVTLSLTNEEIRVLIDALELLRGQKEITRVGYAIRTIIEDVDACLNAEFKKYPDVVKDYVAEDDDWVICIDSMKSIIEIVDSSRNIG